MANNPTCGANAHITYGSNGSCGCACDTNYTGDGYTCRRLQCSDGGYYTSSQNSGCNSSGYKVTGSQKVTYAGLECWTAGTSTACSCSDGNYASSCSAGCSGNSVVSCTPKTYGGKTCYIKSTTACGSNQTCSNGQCGMCELTYSGSKNITLSCDAQEVYIGDKISTNDYCEEMALMCDSLGTTPKYRFTANYSGNAWLDGNECTGKISVTKNTGSGSRSGTIRIEDKSGTSYEVIDVTQGDCVCTPNWPSYQAYDYNNCMTSSDGTVSDGCGNTTTKYKSACTGNQTCNGSGQCVNKRDCSKYADFHFTSYVDETYIISGAENVNSIYQDEYSLAHDSDWDENVYRVCIGDTVTLKMEGECRGIDDGDSGWYLDGNMTTVSKTNPYTFTFSEAFANQYNIVLNSMNYAAYDSHSEGSTKSACESYNGVGQCVETNVSGCYVECVTESYCKSHLSSGYECVKSFTRYGRDCWRQSSTGTGGGSGGGSSGANGTLNLEIELCSGCGNGEIYITSGISGSCVLYAYSNGARSTKTCNVTTTSGSISARAYINTGSYYGLPVTYDPQFSVSCNGQTYNMKSNKINGGSGGNYEYAVTSTFSLSNGGECTLKIE